MSASREEWLQKRHAAWLTPDETLASLVVAATGAGVATKERIIQGEANETYHVVDTEGRHLTVKIAHGRPTAFTGLSRASKLCLDAGIATPEVLHRTVIDEDSAAVVQTFLPGVPLESWLQDRPDEQVADLTREAGAFLARLHSISLPAGDTPMSTAIVDMLERDLAGPAELVSEHGLDPERIRELVSAHAALFDGWPSCFTHGDYGTDHLLVEDGHITGVIDLDSAMPGAAYVDLSWWDTYFSWRCPMDLLLEGYRKHSSRGDDERARVLYNLASGPGKLNYFVEVGQPKTAAWIGVRLERWIEQVESW